MSNLKRSNIVMDLNNSETDQKIYFFGGAWVACVWCLPGGAGGAGGAPAPLFLSI